MFHVEDNVIVRCFTSFLFVFAACSESFAQEVSDSVTIHFRQGYSRLERNWQGNGEALDRISDSLKVRYADSAFVLKHIGVVGGASPEGSIALNKRLSGKRANVLFDYLSAQTALPDSLRTFTYIGRDWRGLLALAERDPGVPWREETLALLRDVAAKCEHGENRADRNLSRLMALRNGEPYRYMYRRLFPELRASRLILTFGKRTHHDPVLFAVSDPERFSAVAFAAPELVRSEITAPPVSAVPPPAILGNPFYMSVKTNLLFDALLVPNIGLEFYLGRKISLAANWMYAWWNSRPAHWFWRIYGGDLSVRKWFGRRAEAKPLTGHHIGLYGQILTYDFEMGGRGQIGGKPGGTLFDKCNCGAGIEYGYALPIARRLNLDFVVGVGYLGGKYYEYLPIDGCNVWQQTKNRRYFGPSKAEISLVWLLGRGNVNPRGGNAHQRKGGRR